MQQESPTRVIERMGNVSKEVSEFIFDCEVESILT